MSSTLVELSATIDAHRDRIIQHYGDEGTYFDKIGQEFKRLCQEYDSKKPICSAIDNFDHLLASFEEMWQRGDTATRSDAGKLLWDNLPQHCHRRG